MTSLAGAGNLAGWQWMFLVEGLPCVVLGLLALKLVPNKPSEATWLTDQERRMLEADLGHVGAAHSHSFRAVARDKRIYVLAFAYFCIIAAIYAISFWLPTLIKAQGVTDTVQLGWYAAVPYIGAAFGMYYMGRRSDRKNERRFHCAVPALAGGVLLAASTLADGHLFLTLALLTLGTTALWMTYTVFWAIPPAYLKGPAAAGGIALINTIGLSGGFWGPAIIGWAKTATGNLHLGVLVMASLPVLAALIVITNKLPAHR
jgi:nitrate/nitrite transporter NarK